MGVRDESGGPPPELIEEFDYPNLRGCRVGPLLVQAWSGQPVTQAQDALIESFEAMIERHPAGFASLALIRMSEAIGSPDANLRSWAHKYYSELVSALTVSAIVIDADSVSGRTVRVFIKALLLLARPEVPTRVFASFDEAFEWMVEVEGGMAPALVAEAPSVREQIHDWWAGATAP